MSHRSRWLAPALSLSLVACVVDPTRAPVGTPSPAESQAVVSKGNPAVVAGSLAPALQTPTPAPAGQLAGTVLAPPGYASNPGMNMVAAGGLNAVASGQLVAAGSLNYRLGPDPARPARRKLLNLTQEVVAGAPVQLFDARNQALTEPVLTDQAGNYLIPKLPEGGGPYVIKVGVKTPAGAAVVLESLVRPAETLRGDVDLATTMVTAAVLARSGGKLDGVRAREFKRATNFVSAAISEEALPDLADPQKLADAVLGLAATSNELRGSVLTLAGEAAPETPGPDGSATPGPDASGTPDPDASGTPNPSGSAGASASPTPRPTAKPIATPPPLAGPELYTAVRLAVGTDQEGAEDGDAAKATFRYPKGIAFDAGNRLYIADSGNKALRMVAADGTVSTIVSDKVKDAAGAAAPWTKPYDVATDAAGTTCWVSDGEGKKIYTVTHTNGKAATVKLLAGGKADFNEGTGAEAGLEGPLVMASDGRGMLFVADAKDSKEGGARILKVDTATGAVSLYAGGALRGAADGKARTEAKFQQPSGIAVRYLGTTREVWVADAKAGNVRRIVEKPNEEPVVTTVIGPLEPNAGVGDARITGFFDTFPLTGAKFNQPGRMVFSPDGDLFVIDTNNERIRWVRFEGDEPAEIRALAPASVATGGTTKPFEIKGTPCGIAFAPDTETLYVSQVNLSRIAEIK